MALGLLLLRVLLATILFMHATQKVFGWFSGPGLGKSAMMFEALGQHPGRQMTMLAAASESGGSLLILLGLATPLGGAVLAGTMIVAGSAMTITSGSVWNSARGGEYPFVLGGIAVVLGFTGPGRWSLDHALAAPWSDLTPGKAAALGGGFVLVAALASVPSLLRTRHSLAKAHERGSTLGATAAGRVMPSDT